jgi:hypothetical protein
MLHFGFFHFLLLVFTITLQAQPVPGDDENIPYLVTFGPKADASWGIPVLSEFFSHRKQTH